MSDEVTENLVAPKAADLPVGSIVATDTLVGLKAEPSGPLVSAGWRMTNGGYYHDKHIDEMLAGGAAILR